MAALPEPAGGGVATTTASNTQIAQVSGGGGGGGGKGKGGGGKGQGKKSSSGRAAFTDRAVAQRTAVAVATRPLDGASAVSTTPVLQATAAVQHVPTQVERNANQSALRTIRARYGSRAQTLINALLAFDAYFAWWFPLKRSIPFMAPQEVRVSRALDNCRLAIDMHEIFERVAINNHGSFLPHGAIFKVSRDILLVGDVWACGTSPLELQNAETKRVASDVGARNITFIRQGDNATTMALSTFSHLLSAQHLRSGEGERVLIDSRRQERVFGENGKGRMTTAGRPKEEKGVGPKTCLEFFASLCDANFGAVDAPVKAPGLAASGDTRVAA